MKEHRRKVLESLRFHKNLCKKTMKEVEGLYGYLVLACTREFDTGNHDDYEEHETDEFLSRTNVVEKSFQEIQELLKKIEETVFAGKNEK